MTDPDPIRARELAAQACDLETKHARALDEALAPIRAATGADDATLRTVLQDAANADDDATALAVFEAAVKPPPLLVNAAAYANTPQPAPVLWRDPDLSEPDPGADPNRCDAVLSVGECAILASAGGLGKSTLTLEVASAAVAAAALGEPFSATCGLRVAPGPVVLVSFEDGPARIAHRLTWMNAGKVPAAVHLAPDPAPLWMAAADRGGESHPSAQWDALWREVRAAGARLVVVDPVTAALADVSTTETGPVRAFLRALSDEAAPDPEADWRGCGVLLVCHSNKAGRNALARGEDPGADLVGGSAAWYDGARSVLSLMRDPIGGEDRLLECVKANYGRTGWGARLIERTGPGGAFRGLTLGARLIRDALETAKLPPKRRKAAAIGAGKVPTGPGLIP